MTIWMLTDPRGCIVALNPNDMTGNSGWSETTTDALGLTADSELRDDHGASLYVFTAEGAAARALVERQANWPEEQADNSLEGRVAANEGTLHTHDQEISEIVTGLEALSNGQ